MALDLSVPTDYYPLCRLVFLQDVLLSSYIFRRSLRRPHTDDAIQMLDDLGIEPPDRNRVSRDGKTYDLRK